MKQNKNEEAINLLADLLFSYINKEEDNPHDFEVSAVNETADYLKEHYRGTKYNEAFFERCKTKINQNR